MHLLVNVQHLITIFNYGTYHFLFGISWYIISVKRLFPTTTGYVAPLVVLLLFFSIDGFVHNHRCAKSCNIMKIWYPSLFHIEFSRSAYGLGSVLYLPSHVFSKCVVLFWAVYAVFTAFMRAHMNRLHFGCTRCTKAQVGHTNKST